MRMMRILPFIAAAAALLLRSTSAADPIVVLDNQVPGRAPDSGRLVGQNLEVNEQLAENFILTRTTSITSIQVSMYGGDSGFGLFPGNAFSITLYSDVNHQPGVPVFSQQFQVPNPDIGYQWCGLSGSDMVTLPPGSYWVALGSVDNTSQGFVAMYTVPSEYPEEYNYVPGTSWVAFSDATMDLRILGENIQTAQLANLSVRSTAGTGSQTLIGGFVIQGSGTKSVLVRGDGPALASFNVSGVLPDPVLTLFDSTATQLAANAGWGGSAALSSAFSQVGAFSLNASSKDAALLSSLGSGPYTAQISSTSGDSGVVLIEVYDEDAGAPASRIINLSARSEAGTASQTLIAGFAIWGTGTETVLIRGVGPGLTPFGVSGVLAAPQLSLFDSTGTLIATNTNWASASTRGASSVQASLSAATSSVFALVGAFALPAASADCALVATLPPGTYTAQVTGVNGTTGVALVEIYEIP